MSSYSDDVQGILQICEEKQKIDEVRLIGHDGLCKIHTQHLMISTQ